ncbi:protein of unknown function [Faecalicatena contorta]|uniref:DUF1540 domain-containing protein n=1 Tax=Faecalicatena contorta TaxID=39482 RepID=A0A315ZZR9_9FIRM|nr:DUF1540 domain-containing protein [Faecalicatena contorta]PWJ50779.1 uncharacterized protein DUF1540 [Faecalicatena contorta]SUQ13347.1 protein of unknown function [Faecalicatena contorta]
MPELKCTVQTCVHNKQFLCDLDKIQVGGSEAKTARETCCDSFRERTTNGYSNSYSGSSMNSSSSSYSGSSMNSLSSSYSGSSMNSSANGYSNSHGDITGRASDRSGIDCKAVECMYNNNYACHAGKISVEGSNAKQSEGTECATFKYKS